MVHERDDEYEGQEDGEYHFSDDQANYEAEPEAPSPAAAPVVAKPAPAPGSVLQQYRRPLIGVGIFLFLIFLVYKILAPSSSTPTAEFAQNNLSAPKKLAYSQHPQNAAPEAPREAPAPAAAPAVAEAQPQPQEAQPAQVQPAEPVLTVSPGASPAQPPQPQGLQQAQAMPSQEQAVPAGSQNVIDKLLSLQEQNTRLINQLESENAEKTSSAEAQNNATQGKLQDLSMRINSIEATLTRLGRAIQEMKGGTRALLPSSAEAQVSGPSAEAPMMARPVPEPKSAYIVQAIIPGRAWLKSESGETVTVAEGDTLKNYGRIIKIDPYDGVVQIDVGGRLVSLSYGVANE